VRVGGDILRPYLIRHTKYEDYDSENRSAYLYSLGKDVLLKGQTDRAIGYLNGMASGSHLWPYALQLRGTAHAVAGHLEQALQDFRGCAGRAHDYSSGAESSVMEYRRRESDDLHARCRAGEARTLYEQNHFEQADRAYDRIPKASFVWTDILFEQAWNAFGRQEYNRTLGKLVSYKAPGSGFRV